MTNKEFQTLLQHFPDDLPIKLMRTHETVPDGNNRYKYPDAIEFTDENIMESSETAHVNPDAPEDEWDNEDGKLELGDGQRFILINPVIL